MARMRYTSTYLCYVRARIYVRSYTCNTQRYPSTYVHIMIGKAHNEHHQHVYNNTDFTYLIKSNIEKKRAFDRSGNVSQTYKKIMKKIARINSTPQVIRACICIIRSILQGTQRAPPTCIQQYRFHVPNWRDSPTWWRRPICSVVVPWYLRRGGGWPNPFPTLPHFLATPLGGLTFALKKYFKEEKRKKGPKKK